MAETLRPQDELLERDDELRRLRARLDEAAAGRGGVAIVEGPAGIGKTRLLTALRDDARVTVLSARCSELERDYAFGAVRQLLEPAVRDPARRARVLQGAAAAAAPVLDATADGEGGFAALHGLHWAVLELAEEGPLLLAIDDLQWSDRASLRFVAYLARRLEGVPVLVAATVRSTDPGTDPVLLAEVCGDPAATVLRPGPLGADAVERLCSARLGGAADPAFAAACADATGGNPLLLHQLLSALGADGVRPSAAGAAAVREIGPRAVSRTVLLRLARLPGAASAVARAVAVLGEQASLPTVAAFCGLPESDVAAAVGALVRADVLEAGGGGRGALGFVHPLVRGAVYDDLPPGERDLAHARAAAVLRDRGAGAPAVAAQLLHAPARGEQATVETLREAAADAERRGSPESAVAFLTRALHEPPPDPERGTVLLELGLAQAEMDPPGAAEHLRLAQDVLVADGDRATAGFVRAQALIFTSRSAEGAGLAHDVARQLPDDHADVRDALTGLEVLAVYFGGGDPRVLDRLAALAAPWTPQGPGGRFLAGAAAFSRATAAHPPQEVERLAHLATAGEPLMRGSGLFWSAVLTALVLVESPRTGTVLEQARVQEHRRGSSLGLSSIGLFGGLHLLQLGDLDDAEVELGHAVASQETLGNDPTTRRWSQSMLATLALLRGSPDAAAALIGDPPADHETSDGSNLARGVHAELLLLAQRPGEALQVTDTMLRTAPHVVHPSWKRAPSPRARALHALGRTDEAVAVLDDALALARRAGGSALVAQGLRDRAAVTPADAIPLLQEAHAGLAGSPARLERALTALALGAALRRDRRPTEAREPLREALALAEACGCAPAVQQARTELQATGARPRSAALSGVGALTASELRVAGLAAEGRTNREVAQTLFVTPKTVEVHLSSAYRKLGIRSRRELAAALA